MTGSPGINENRGVRTARGSELTIDTRTEAGAAVEAAAVKPGSLFSGLFPRPVGDGVAVFVEFDVVDEGLGRFAGEAALLDALREDTAAFVALAELDAIHRPSSGFPRRNEARR